MSGISIFMYHQVGRFPPIRTHRASYCDVDRFRWQMRMLRLFGIQVISMSEAAAALRGEVPVPARAAVLTFDDGCANFREHALPILEEFGYPSIVYAIAGMVGGSAAWLAESGHATPPLMDWVQLRDIAARGVEIGSHSLHHIRLAEQSPEVQRHELAASRQLLEQELGRPVLHACYPYGSHDLHTLQAAQAAGYATAVTCQRAAATPDFDPLALPRKAISYGDNALGFLWKLYMKDAPKGEAIRRMG
ncbi:polysaccharide deacetylase family protein [Corticibacter populi]|uniref:Polysaccharide deacetylase family protein n=1 Tax=Corticibacter populi TaxID=1550736 RepID=A0A3M6QMB6_9BURK|nr:polysaccharide deacetylase family protein [Corticibacter populi]RMX04184.1 polysaccharide deacetylase family protein [Corticibacter populi]RZS33206.1 polysaccharide deacetylase [Corticibacter populi]